MTTAMIISELISLHDDELVADIDATFDRIDHEVAAARDLEQRTLLLDVEWLVDEMLEQTVRISREALDISIEITGEDSTVSEPRPAVQVAEVA